MSLHKFAEQVASQGRGDDSLLVHMTPDEVRKLQQFAQANGTTLTINPTTGLPEAGMLSDLFKAIAPIALGAFLGPAGLGMSSMMAGVATGGITTLATGSLSRGLMAGLGAYGGAGLGESFMGAGSTALGGVGAETALQAPSVNSFVGNAEGMTSGDAFNNFLKSDANPAVMGKTDVFGAGAKAAMADPLGFAKNNLGNLAYASAPILAGAMVPTTTKLGDPKSTGNIRQMAYNINPDTGMPDPLYGRREMPVVKASEFGDKTFQGQRDLFYQQNPNPYQLGVGSLNQPPQQQPAQMNTGGIVALAGGGVPGYANGMLVGDKDVFNYFKGLDQAKLASGALDAQIAADMQKYNVGAADIGRITGTQANQGDFEKRFVQAIDPTTLSSADFLAKTADVGLKDQALANAMKNAGMSASAQYAATHNLNDAAGITGAPQSAQDFYNTFGYKAGDLKGDTGGIAGLYTNINQVAGSLQDQINAGKITVEQAQRLSSAEMERLGINQADIKGATGKDLFSLFKPKTETKTTLNCPAGYRPNAAGTACELIPITNPPPDPFVGVTPTGFYGNNTGNPLTSTPGDITTNKDGTVTVTPNIPGRPDGGFTGMGQVRDTYTAGGGSLGYTAKVPKTAAEHNAMYNKLTDDSLDAYNFLMGKGKNLTQRKAETRNRPVMQRYDEAVLGRKIAKPTKTTTTDKVTTVVGTPGNPQSYFDEAAYLAANPSVAEELRTGKSVSGQPVLFTSGYDHYLKYGKAGGRPFTGDYQGYTTALALANSAGAGGGGGGGNTTSATTGNTASTVGLSNNEANSITGLAAAPNNSISVSDAVSSPASSATPSGGSTSVGDAAATSGDGDGDGDGDGGGSGSGGSGDGGDGDGGGC